MDVLDFVEYFLAHQRLDGGFPYYPSDRASLEPTCYAVLCLNKFSKYLANRDKATLWLLEQQNNDGGWKTYPEDPTSSAYFTGLALTTLINTNKKIYKASIDRGISFLQGYNDYIHNNKLNYDVWGWNEGSFISVEASTYPVIALKMADVENKYRINQAESFFLENTCYCGGWTYSNPVDTNNPYAAEVIYTPLEPQLHVTALVLLALQELDKPIDEHISLIYELYDNSFCPFSLGLAAIALTFFNKKADKILERINTLIKQDSYSSKLVFNNILAALANNTSFMNNPFRVER